VIVTELTENRPGLKRIWHLAKKLRQAPPSDLYFVGYTGAVLVPCVRLLSTQKIVYNALASFYESMIISRQAGSPRSFTAWKYWLIDWLAFKGADLILVESQAQKDFIATTFRVAPAKITVHYTGVEPQLFFDEPEIKKLETFTVLFRGKFLPEAGVEVMLGAAKKLAGEKINFRIIGHGLLQNKVEQLLNDLQLPNVELITDFLDQKELRSRMSECHLALGQLANHPRLARTIPHKAFECLALGLPYLTARQPGVLELLTENENCFCFKGGDEQDLADSILRLKNDQARLARIALAGSNLYHTTLNSRSLGQKLIEQLPPLLPPHSN
jgi:glycosyltransferase involved in cell wall biosynthesis